jgi:hypothetical protein
MVAGRTKILSLVCVGLAILPASGFAKEKHNSNSSNDPTSRLYQLLDSSHDGKLQDYYLLADVYPDTTHPGSELQHVLLVDYDKTKFFGRFQFHVRSIGKPTDDQLKAYTVKQLYDFGVADMQAFEKIKPGTFGETGDLYLESPGGNDPLASAPITEAVAKEYDLLVSQYILPSLDKK